MLLFLGLFFSIFQVASSPPLYVLRIDCGSIMPTKDHFGQIWEADHFFIGGRRSFVSNHGHSRFNYKVTLRHFRQRGCYSIPVTLPGVYLIQSYIVYNNYDDMRTPPEFDVSVQGTIVFRVRRPWKSEQGFYDSVYAYLEGFVDICFHGKSGSPIISSLMIRRLHDSDEVVRIIGYDYIMDVLTKELYSREVRGRTVDYTYHPYKRSWVLDRSFVSPYRTIRHKKDYAMGQSFYARLLYDSSWSWRLLWVFSMLTILLVFRCFFCRRRVTAARVPIQAVDLQPVHDWTGGDDEIQVLGDWTGGDDEILGDDEIQVLDAEHTSITQAHRRHVKRLFDAAMDAAMQSEARERSEKV